MTQDLTRQPDHQHGDEPLCNHSGNPVFADVVDARIGRRGLMMGGLASAVTAVFGLPYAARNAAMASTTASALLGFKPVPVSEADTVVVPPGYRVQVMAPWGQSIRGGSPALLHASTGAQQAEQIGMHHDAIHFFPLDGSSTDGLLAMNHEYVEPRYMHASYAGKKMGGSTVMAPGDQRDPDEVLKEINSHGVSIVRVSRTADGDWEIKADPRNRRITGATPMEIRGPARGAAHMRTKYSPDGTRCRGTLNNCAHGVTPWNTYMTAEENWAGYFRNGDQQDQKPNLPREQARYGVATGRSRYAWELAAGGADEFVRFDASSRGGSPTEDYRNEPNTFGWMVEIDPFNPASVPVKRTALGRFAHEGVVFAPAVPGKPVVCYSGDDAAFEYIYKFVSAAAYDPATASGALLDDGTLYVARFDKSGTGEWIELTYGRNGLTAANGFADQADVLVNTRLAGDTVGATKMDRPEWGAVDPKTGDVYFTLTNNSRRTEAQADGPNPRAKNIYGQIVRWTEVGDHASTSFRWSLFALAGDQATSRTATGKALGDEATFACPDGLWFDADGRMWIQTDIGEAQQNKGPHKVFGNNAMLAADPVTGEIRRFLTGPVGQEITGVVTTPDQRTMFVNVQHPGATTSSDEFAAGKLGSHWPDGGNAVPRSATLVITRQDGGKIGA